MIYQIVFVLLLCFSVFLLINKYWLIVKFYLVLDTSSMGTVIHTQLLPSVFQVHISSRHPHNTK